MSTPIHGCASRLQYRERQFVGDLDANVFKQLERGVVLKIFIRAHNAMSST